MKICKITTLIFFIFTASLALAGNEGGGGDICENKMRNISNDIEKWLLEDEYKGIKLPTDLSEDIYKEGMLNAIKISLLSCTTDKIYIGKAEKTCKNFDDENGQKRIMCNFDRLMKTSDSEQYLLMHHEFAGVAGFELSYGNETSNYQISNQISDYLQAQVVTRLGVKHSNQQQQPLKCNKLDHSKSIPVGTQCTTSRGFTFQRVSKDKFIGEAWQGPDGLIWGDFLGEFTYSAAIEFCKKLNGSLPTLADFERAIMYGQEEVLPNVYFDYWTTTLDGYDHPYKITYSGFKLSNYPDMLNSARCIGN
jgi:hypothetical protein